MFKYLLFIFFFLFLPFNTFAQNTDYSLRAEVIEVIASKNIEREDGSVAVQQDLRLRIITGDQKGQEIEIDNIDDLDVISAGVYEPGDKVVVLASHNEDGETFYSITDRVRTGSLLWLTIIFALVIIGVSKYKGLKALLGLILSFIVIMKLVIPLILGGYNPLLVSLIGSFLILLLLIYITEGINSLSHISIAAIFISLAITGLLAWWFVNLASLTGAGEEALYLVGIGKDSIDLRGLLLSGIVIGTLGVLDDVVVSQVALVREINNANKELNNRQVFARAMKVGVTHIGAMANTLFLAYAGVSLPLLLLFASTNPPFVTTIDVFNNELIATEIVRTLTGSIGLSLAAPIATLLAVKFFKTNSPLKKDIRS